jgi:hypothetical protein
MVKHNLLVLFLSDQRQDKTGQNGSRADGGKQEEMLSENERNKQSESETTPIAFFFIKLTCKFIRVDAGSWCSYTAV